MQNAECPDLSGVRFAQRTSVGSEELKKEPWGQSNQA